MGWLFKSEVEKELERWAKHCPEIEIKYAKSKDVRLSKVLTVNADMMTIVGFSGDLESKKIDVRNIENQFTFETTIMKRGYGKKGEILFAVKLPKSISPPSRRTEERLPIYPHAEYECIVTTNHGNQSVRFKLLDICSKGCALINTTGVQFKMGTSLYQGMLHMGDAEGILINCQVTNHRKIKIGGKPVEVLGCFFKSDPDLINEVMAHARRLSKSGHRLSS